MTQNVAKTTAPEYKKPAIFHDSSPSRIELNQRGARKRSAVVAPVLPKPPAKNDDEKMDLLMSGVGTAAEDTLEAEAGTNEGEEEKVSKTISDRTSILTLPIEMKRFLFRDGSIGLLRWRVFICVMVLYLTVRTPLILSFMRAERVPSASLLGNR